MTQVRGECDSRFAAVRDTLEATLSDGRDVGASACVIVDGEVVVDLWGGHADAVVVPARNVVPRPPGRSWEECAAYPLATLTAYRMLRRARLAAAAARSCSAR